MSVCTALQSLKSKASRREMQIDIHSHVLVFAYQTFNCSYSSFAKCGFYEGEAVVQKI